MSRRSWLLAGLAAPLFALRGQDKLNASYDGDNVHVTAPGLHFLIDKPLKRLTDGATVVYLAQLGLYADSACQSAIRLAPIDRFAISNDVWRPDRFSVTLVTGTPKTKDNLSAAQAEAWCVENMAVSASNLGQDRQFWVRLDMRTADQRDLSGVVMGPGFSLMELAVRLSRKAVADDPKWSREAGPFRLTDLVRTPGRGPRNG